eukprot:630360-Pyramimonas_sp.AAC.1
MMMMMMMMMLMLMLLLMMVMRGTSGNLRAINDVGIHLPSKLPHHRLLRRFISTEGTASLKDNV